MAFLEQTNDIFRESYQKLFDSMQAWKQPSTDSCHVLQSLIFMMLGNMGETHNDGIPVKFIIFDYDISAWMLQFYI